MMAAPEDAITLETQGKIAIITLNQPKKLNALDQQLYFRLATLLREVAARRDIYITILTGKGRYFSAGADVTPQAARDNPAAQTRRDYLRSFVANNLEVTHAFYAHPKVLVAALNGPAVGLSAALVAHADFIYAAPHTFLLTPFSALGLVAEGNASRAFVERLGIARANEALLMSKRLDCAELVAAGFVNKVFDDVRPGEDDKFRALVLREVGERLGEHVNADSLLEIKAMIRGPERRRQDAQLVDEVLGGLGRFEKGLPQEEFRKIASREKRHKL